MDRSKPDQGLVSAMVKRRLRDGGCNWARSNLVLNCVNTFSY